MYSCYIIDDETFSIEALKRYIEKVPELILLKSFQNPLLALEEIRKGEQPDIIFLDINMPELSGLSVADLLPKNISVVFTTGHCKYAINGFEKDVVDFLLKPYSFENFLRAVTKVKNKRDLKVQMNLLPEVKSIFINPGAKGKLVQIFFSEILYLEAKDHLVAINTQTEAVHTKVSIAEILAKLSLKNFIRVHRSFIINIDFIKSMDHNNVLLKTGANIPITSTHKSNLLKMIHRNSVNII